MGSFEAAGPAFFRKGQPYTSRIPAMVPKPCSEPELSVRGVVLDESNVEVPSEWSMLDEDMVVANLSFTPAGDGPYYFAAELNPNLGRSQGFIVQDFDAPGRKLMERSTQLGVERCTDVLSDGSLLCDTIGESLIVSAEGVVLRRLPALAVSAGSAVWATNRDSMELLRLTLDAGTWTLEQTVPAAAMAIAAATPDEAFGYEINGNRRVRYQLDAGALVRSPLPEVATPSSFQASITRDRKAWWAVDATSICLNPLPEGPARCVASPGGVTTVEPDGVWFQGGSISLLTVDAGVLSMPDPGTWTPMAPLLLREATFATGHSMVVLRNGALRVETFPSRFNGGSISSDGTKVLLVDQMNALVTVYER